MRGNFSPMAEAARLMAVRAAVQPRVIPPAVGPLPAPGGSVVNERWCELPRRPASNPPFIGVRQALLAIQARHA